jgi:hypothetical protein
VRRGTAFAALAFLAALTFVSGASAATQTPVAARADALTRALESGRLTKAEYALERARALFHLARVRQVWGDVARPGPRDATLVLRELALRKGSLPPAKRRQAAQLLARPTDGANDPFGDGWAAPRRSFRRTCTANFCLHWVRRTADAPPLRDADGDRIPDSVERLRSIFRRVWAVEIGSQGFRRPKSDLSSGAHRGGNPNGNLDVFLADVGADGLYGYCTTDDPALAVRSNVSAFCVLDDDFSPLQFSPGATGRAAAKVTSAHEFFHAVQFAYDVREDIYFMEGSAVAQEDVVFDGVNDGVRYLRKGPLNPVDSADDGPWVPLDTSASPHSYGSWIFFRFLSEYLGDGAVLRRLWRRADARPGARNEYSTEAIANFLATRGKSLREAFADFGWWNAVPAARYSEGSLYPTAGASEFELGRRDSVSGAVAMYHLSNRYLSFVPAENGNAPARLELTLDLPAPGQRGLPAATVLVFSSDGVTVQRVQLDDSGDASLELDFDPASVSEVVLVLTNAGHRFNCWRRALYSCQGIPLDDTNNSFRVVAEASG